MGEGVEASELMASGYTPAELSKAKVSANDIAAAAAASDTVTVTELKEVNGMSAKVLRKNGFGIKQLLRGMFSGPVWVHAHRLCLGEGYN